MAVFRLAKGRCPDCGKWQRKQLNEGAARRRKVALTCPCGATWNADLSPNEWWASWREPSGKYHRERFTGNDARARAVLAEVEARSLLHEGVYTAAPIEFGGTLGELIEVYLEHLEALRKPANLVRDRGRLQTVANQLGSGLPLAKVTGPVTDAYRRARTKEGRAVATCNRELAALGAALRWAKAQGWVSKVPKMHMPNPQNEKTDFLTRDETAKAIMASRPPYRALVKLAVATGMRRGELLALRWEWISERSNTINLPPTATKNGRARHVPINSDAREALAEARRVAIPGAPVFHRGGKPLSGAIVWKEWTEALVRAGVRHVRFHDLRHSFASWLAQGGVDLNRIRELLGHRSIEMVMRYSHLQPEHLQAAAEIACLSAPSHPGTSVVQGNTGTSA